MKSKVSVKIVMASIRSVRSVEKKSGGNWEGFVEYIFLHWNKTVKESWNETGVNEDDE